MKVLTVMALAGATAATVPSAVRSQERDQSEEPKVLAVVEAALMAISNEDMVGFTDLMIDDAVMYSVTGAGEYSVRPRAQERARTFDADLVERGFDAEVRVQGPVAVVWMPYDFYINGTWSHCGVDVFTLVRTSGTWRISSASWSVDQPPACRRHPNGPPPSE